MTSDNVTPFPAAGAEQDRRHATYEPLPPVSRAFAQMLDCARSVRRQRDLIDSVDSLRLLALLPVPTISPIGTRAMREVRGALIDELVHELIPEAQGKTLDLLCALSLWLRDMGAGQ